MLGSVEDSKNEKNSIQDKDVANERFGYLKFINRNSRDIRKFQILILFLTTITGILLIIFTLDLSSFLTSLFEKASLNSFILELLPLILIFSAITATSIISAYISQIITYSTRSKLMENTFYSVSSGRMSKIKSLMIGDIITRTTGDTIQISGIVATFLPGLISSILLFGFYFVALFLISPLLSYIFLLFSPLYYFIFLIERKMLPPLVNKERAALSRVTNSVNEYTLNLEDLKALSAITSISKIYKSAVGNFYATSKQMINSLIKYSGASSYLKAIMPFIILTVSFYFYTINLVAIGSAITFFFISGQAYSPLSSISGYLSSYATGIARYRRVEEILNIEPEATGETPLKSISQIESVGVKVINGDKNILNIDKLRVLSGEHIGITGENGSGKSTLSRLFNNSIEFSGKVEINGLDIKNYRLGSLREKAIRIDGIPFIFVDTVYNNISLYANISREDVEKAMKICNIDFVRLDDIVEPSNLSEGQKQHISLARAVCRKPEFLILDEVFSGIDDRSEEKIVANILEEMSGSTILLISHRYSTLKRMDRAIIMKQGQIICDVKKWGDLSTCSEWESLMKHQSIK